jgi:hypothetical protein
MKNKYLQNRFILSLVFSFFGFFALAFAFLNSSFAGPFQKVFSDSVHYSLTFDDQINLPETEDGTFIATSDSGSEIRFKSSELSYSSGEWGRLTEGGYFYNTTRISGIESITFLFEDETSAITLWWGWMVETEQSPLYENQINLDYSNPSVNLADQTPGCFKVVAFADTTIKSFSISYTCSQSSIPNNGITYTFNSFDDTYIVTDFTGLQNNVVIRKMFDNGVNGEHPVSSINPESFRDCSSVASVAIPDSVEKVGTYAFYGCSSLEYINIPDSVTVINDATFGLCSSLASLDLPSSLTSIGNFAFFSCEVLHSITFPTSLTNIGAAAFIGCSSITPLILPDTISSIGDGAFSNIGGNIFIEFESMPVGWSSSCLEGTITYWYSEVERTDGNFWHYVGNIPTPWQV